MDNKILMILSMAVAFLLSFVCVPIVRIFAFKYGAVDVPKDNRRMHTVPIPRMGGLAIYFGFLVSYLCFTPTIEVKDIGIILGGTILVAVGIIDDKYALRASVKLLFQIIAAVIPVMLGLKINFITNVNIFSKGTVMMLGALSVPITVIWIIGLTNALNLIDGLDGLAGGIASISAVSLMIVSLFAGRYEMLIPLGAIAGATLGFLPFNINPAKIFMGDTGALFLGYMLACFSVSGFFKSYAAISFLIPFMVLGLPIFDTGFAILRRISKGKPIMSPDRSHLHHKLVDAGFSQRQAVGILCSITGLFSLTAIVLATEGYKRALLMLVVSVIYCFAVKYYVNNKNCEKIFMDKLEESKEQQEKQEK